VSATISHAMHFAKNSDFVIPSNSVEKTNDIVVAKRQKRDGMGWSDDGSIAFASVSAANHNDQLGNWLNYGFMNFSLNCSATAACL